MFLQQQASPVVHTVGGRSGGGGRGEEGKGGREREKGRGRGGGEGGEEGNQHDTKDQWSKLLPTSSVAHYVSKTS